MLLTNNIQELFSNQNHQILKTSFQHTLTKAILLVLIALFVPLLSACGGGEESSSAGGTQGSGASGGGQAIDFGDYLYPNNSGVKFFNTYQCEEIDTCSQESPNIEIWTVINDNTFRVEARETLGAVLQDEQILISTQDSEGVLLSRTQQRFVQAGQVLIDEEGELSFVGEVFPSFEFSAGPVSVQENDVLILVNIFNGSDSDATSSIRFDYFTRLKGDIGSVLFENCEREIRKDEVFDTRFFEICESAETIALSEINVTLTPIDLNDFIFTAPEKSSIYRTFICDQDEPFELNNCALSSSENTQGSDPDSSENDEEEYELFWSQNEERIQLDNSLKYSGFYEVSMLPQLFDVQQEIIIHEFTDTFNNSDEESPTFTREIPRFLAPYELRQSQTLLDADAMPIAGSEIDYYAAGPFAEYTVSIEAGVETEEAEFVTKENVAIVINKKPEGEDFSLVTLSFFAQNEGLFYAANYTICPADIELSLYTNFGDECANPVIDIINEDN